MLACLSAFALTVSGAVAFAGSSNSSNSNAVITGQFSDECRDFEAHAEKPDGKPKDISYVELHYADGRVVKDESVNSPDYSIDEGPGDEKTKAIVKSGQTVEEFTCDGGGEQPECSDGVDNDGDKKIDYPEDPGCDSPEDNDESDDPTTPECSDGVDNDKDGWTDYPDDPGCDSEEDDSESPNPECSDGVDNDGDGKVDTDDPECHTDGDATNPDSYDPRDDDESNGGGGDGGFSCRASALRVDGSPLAPIIGDPFEPFVANDAKDPCADEDASLINTGDQISGPPGTLTIKAAHAETSDDNGADAEAGVVNVIIKDPTGAEILRVGVLNASATGRCDNGQPVLDGESEVVGLNINGNEATIPQDDPATPEDESFTEIPLGPLGTVFLNWEEDSGNELTRRALFFEGSPLGDVIIGEAIADFDESACA
ncbi:MAG: hypothetical protein GEV04_19320 [Actinophytocola sp.]|nr:hypothetical protein [Actinophytocola sp.]